MASKVFVGNLDFNTTRAEVQTLFSEIGAIRDVYLPMDRTTGRPRGFAFVEFESDEDAAKAIEKFNGFTLGGRALRVNAAEDRPRTGGGSFGARRPQMMGGPPPEYDFGRDEGYGGGGGGDFYGRGGGGKNKGSRRNIRAKKRSL